MEENWLITNIEDFTEVLAETLLEMTLYDLMNRDESLRWILEQQIRKQKYGIIKIVVDNEQDNKGSM